MTTRCPALSRYARTTSPAVWSSSTTRIGAPSDACSALLGASSSRIDLPSNAGLCMVTTHHSAKVAEKPGGALPPGCKFERFGCPPWIYAETVTNARPEVAAGSPLAADWFTAPRSPEALTGAEAISVEVRTKNQPPPVTWSMGWTPTVAATADRRVSPPPGPMLYEETVPDAAFARYARLPAAFTTSQHAAACDSPTSLMGCKAPAAPTR